MNVTLGPELERRVIARLERGDYDTADALFQEAVHRLIEEDDADLDSLRLSLSQANREIDRGEGLEFDAATTVDLVSSIHERGMKRLAAMRKPNLAG